MQILVSVVIALLIIIVPGLMEYLAHRYKSLSSVGPILLCYASGIVLGLILNAMSADTSIASSFVDYTIPIAIPLILFSADFSSMKRMAKKTVVSFALMCISVLAVSTAGFLIFRNRLPEADGLAGMMTGLYTGGTPNLYAVGSALHVSGELIAGAVGLDTIAGGIYFFLLISVIPPVVRKILGSSNTPLCEESVSIANPDGEKHHFADEKMSFCMLRRRIPALLLAVACFGFSAIAALVITGGLNGQWVVAIVMLCVTSLGIALSFISKIREMYGAYDTGQYLIYMFSFAMGLTLDLNSLGANVGVLALFVLFAQFGSVILHLILSRLFRIDAETAVITSTAGIYGPAFIAPVADALNSRDAVIPGLVCGIFGYAVGNYIGCALGMLLGML